MFIKCLIVSSKIIYSERQLILVKRGYHRRISYRTHVRSFVTWVCSFVLTFGRSFVSTYVRSFVRKYVRTFVRSLARKYVCKFVRSSLTYVSK